MTKNIPETPEISPGDIEIIIADLTSKNPRNKIGDLDNLTKYIVLKCLTDNISNVHDIDNHINALRDTPAYKHFYKYYSTNLWVSKYKTNLLKKLNEEDVFQEDRFIKIDIEQRIKEESKNRTQDQDKYQDIKDFIKEANCKDSLILLGDVGAGKTSTLRYYLKDCLDNLNPADPNSIIPVFIPLERYKKYPEISSLVTVAINEFIDVSSPTKETFDQDSYNFSLIFDGLDEVPYELRDDVIDSLKRALNQKNKVIISCRLKDYGDNFNNIQYYRLKELTDEQIKKHLKRFFDKDALVIFKQKMKQEQNIHDMAKNPFLLDIMIDIIKSDPEKSLPPNKGKLVEKYVKIIIKKSNEEKANIPNVEKDARNIFLGILAFYMTDEGTLTCYSDDRYSIREKWLSIRDQLDSKDKIETILQKAETERLLKSGSSDGDIEFVNPLIKDYFVANYIKSPFYRKNKCIEEKVEVLLEFYKWDDVIAMVVGIIDENTSDKIMRLLINQDLYFAAQCFPKAKMISSETEDLLINKLICNIDNHVLDSIRKSSVFALGYTLSDRSIKVLLNLIEMHKDINVPNYAAQVLGEIKLERAEEPLIKLLEKSNDYIIFNSVLDVLCKMESGKAVDCIVRLLNNDEKPYLLNRCEFTISEMISDKDMKHFINLLETSEDFWVLDTAIYVLVKANSDKAIKPLIKLMKRKRGHLVSSVAAEALGKLKSEEAVDSLIDYIMFLIENESGTSKNGIERAVWALGVIGSEKAIEPLINLIKNCEDYDSYFFRISKVLSLIKSVKTEEILINLLLKRNINNYALCYVVIALGEIKSKKAIKYLIELLEECDDQYLLDSLVNAIGNIKSKKAIEPLIKLAERTDINSTLESIASAFCNINSVKAIIPLVMMIEKGIGNAAESLVEMNSKKAIAPLLKLLKKNEKWFILDDALYALYKINYNKGDKYFIKLIEENKKLWELRHTAHILSEINSEKSIDLLIKLMKRSKNDYFLDAVTEELRNIKAEEAVLPLINLLEKSKSSEVLDNISNSLVEINSENAIEPLINLLEKNKGDRVSWFVANILCRIKSEKVINSIISIIESVSYAHEFTYYIPDAIKSIILTYSPNKKIDTVITLEKMYKMFDDSIRRKIIYETIIKIKETTGRRYIKQLKGFP